MASLPIPAAAGRLSAATATTTVLLLLAGPASAGRQGPSEDELKVEPAPRVALDVKTPWVAPPRLDEPSSVASSFPSENEDAPFDTRASDPGFRAPSWAGRVLFDEPGDGALWVKGGDSYKARFDTAGATYLPFFGSDAPKNYPLHLVLDEVRVGDQDLAFDREVPFQRDHAFVTYDRGSLVELYELRPEAMEQMFLFDQVPAGGDLVVRIAAQSQLEAFETAEGFEFSNHLGRVGYSRAVVLDNEGHSGEVTTSLADGVIEIRVAAAFLDSAAWPITIDPVVSTFPIEANPAYAARPDVAYDETTDRYNVVWHQAYAATDYDVFSQLRAADGSLITSSLTGIDITSDCWQVPSVANNQVADQFLTVATTSVDCVSPFAIEGRTRDADSNTKGAQIAISGWFSGDKVNADVGGDPVSSGPTYYCVVWERHASPADRDIHYQLVRTDGTLLFGTPQFIDNSSGTFDRQPSVSKSNGQRPIASQEWNVAWQRRVSSNNEDIRGAQVHWNGGITTASFSIDSSAESDELPRASSLLNGGSSPRPYMVVYRRGDFPNTDIQARALIGGVPVTPSTNLSSLEAADPGEIQTTPAVDSDGNCFAVIYSESDSGSTTDYDVYVSTYDLAFATSRFVPNEAHQALGSSSHGGFNPQLTSCQSATDGAPSHPRRFFAAWSDLDISGTGDSDILGGLYDTISPLGASYCFGDGSGTACPCGNSSATDRGCRNSTGLGARLEGTGSIDVSSGDLVLTATSAPPGQPGLLFQGVGAPNGGYGIQFGDGLRCAGDGVIRLQVVVSDSIGTASSTVNIAAAGGVAAGDTRRYQLWYRDPNGSPCGSGFNLTNAYEISWSD